MNITIDFHFKAKSKASRHGSLQLNGRNPEKMTYYWWKRIIKELSFHANLENVIVEGDRDIT
ncbi:hypothetical protein ACIFOT_00525 [Neobacillus sp. NRS-1170]|uniref:hypothetical protein n=1 Tax=Neobacillus sp. NRS-1170 TaxID=3233898 RepID=UPI003D2B75B7